MSAIAPKATELARRNKPPLCAISDHMQRSNSLLDHLASEREQLVWNRETKCLGRGQIDGEIELDWLLDRDVGGLCPAQNLVDEFGGAAEQVRYVCSIGHQTYRFEVLPKAVHRRQSRGKRQGVKPNPVAVHESLSTDIKCIGVALEPLNGGRDIVGAPDFHCGNLKSKRACRCPDVAHLLHGEGIIDIGHNRQLAEAGDKLAQEVESLADKIGRENRQAGNVATWSR